MPKLLKIQLKGKWEVSLIEFDSRKGKRFKTTRRLPELSVAETKVFASRKRAEEQFLDWLN